MLSTQLTILKYLVTEWTGPISNHIIIYKYLQFIYHKWRFSCFVLDTSHKFMMSVALSVLVMIELLSLDSLTHSVMSWLPASCISGRGPMTPLPPSLSLSMMAQKQINWMFLNPLCPIISMYILHTVLCTFPKVLTRRISFKNLWLVIISFILDVWFGSDIVGRNLMLITLRSQRKSSCFH